MRASKRNAAVFRLSDRLESWGGMSAACFVERSPGKKGSEVEQKPPLSGRVGVRGLTGIPCFGAEGIINP